MSQRRRPTVVLMVTVWGSDFVEQFLTLGLRTLLAPGNVPALALECDCTFMVLTRRADVPAFAADRSWQQLVDVCRVEFVEIDDLILHGHHSLTLTLAYERGMRSRGAAMTSTYFVFLVADYIMADGSLATLAPLMREGVSGVTAGNFQVVKEDIEPQLRRLAGPPPGPLRLGPREMVRLSLAHLHPVTRASMPNHPQHTAVCNRLFWPAGRDALVGRFYLRHMLCIRPEHDRFVIGASCDYSFIPEMCQSGRVVALADSDDYMVIEMQPIEHERSYLEASPLTPRRLARSLRQWTTAEHRANAHTAVIFHAGPVSRDVSAVLEASAAYVRRVAAHLPARSQPHRNHPYWLSAVASAEEYRARAARFHDRTVFTTASTRLSHSQAPIDLRLRRVYARCFYGSTGTRPWHPTWHDSRAIAQVLARAIESTPSAVVVANGANHLTDWLARRAPAAWRFLLLRDFIAQSPGEATASAEPHLCFASSEPAESVPALLERLARLPPGSRAIVSVTGPRALPRAYLDDVMPSGLRVAETLRLPGGTLSAISLRWTRVVRRASVTTSRMHLAASAMQIALLALAALGVNLARTVMPALGGSTTGLLLTLERDDGSRPTGSRRSSDGTDDRRRRSAQSTPT